MTRALLAVVLVVTLAAGCGSARRVVSVPAMPEPLPAIGAATDDETLLGAVAAVLVTRLGLPLTRPIRAHFYSSRNEFIRGLIADARIPPHVATEQGATAVGIGTFYGIFLRADELQPSPLPVRVGVIAHELAHVSQFELAGGARGVSEQWIREGFAEWARFQVIDHLGLQAYALSRADALRRVRHAAATGRLVDLEQLADDQRWSAARRTAGRESTYGQSFLAIDRLVQRSGAGAASVYFRQSARSSDRAGIFQQAFGVSRSEFLAEFRRALVAL